MSLVDDLIQSAWLKTSRIIEAFRAIKREDFLPKGSKNLAELNEALPIGWGQTISQPLVVAFMIEKIGPRFGEKILDIGSGSGWTSALLSYLVSWKQNSESRVSKGRVIAIEIIPELMEFGKKNVSKYNFIKRGIVKFVCADGRKGYPEEAPYDKILCSAEARELPKDWKEQLKVGGKIVAPIGNSICVFEKKSEKAFTKEEYPGFIFVPLIET